MALVVVGHSEDHARNPVNTASDEMQINQYQY